MYQISDLYRFSFVRGHDTDTHIYTSEKNISCGLLASHGFRLGTLGCIRKIRMIGRFSRLAGLMVIFLGMCVFQVSIIFVWPEGVAKTNSHTYIPPNKKTHSTCFLFLSSEHLSYLVIWIFRLFLQLIGRYHLSNIRHPFIIEALQAGNSFPLS